MATIKVVSYKDERLEFFENQRRAVQKRYDRLEKTIDPDEPYLSERRELLSDCGRELSFYNDVIEMLENDVVPKSEIINGVITTHKLTLEDVIEHYQKVYAREIFKDFERLMENNEVWFRQTDEIREDFSKLKKKYVTGNL